MLWRAAYRTLVAKDLDLPREQELPLLGRSVLIAGFDLRAYREMQIWQRLLLADAPDEPVYRAFFAPVWTDRDRTSLEALVPESLSAATFAVTDPAEHWKNLVMPDAPERSFCAVVFDGRAKIMMKGAPTEEAWDAFVEALRESN